MRIERQIQNKNKNFDFYIANERKEKNCRSLFHFSHQRQMHWTDFLRIKKKIEKKNLQKTYREIHQKDVSLEAHKE